MSGIMDEVCQQLDDTVLQMFQVLEDIYDKQDKLEQAMKDGFLAMSRARYLLGVKWVSVDQILNADFSSKYRALTDTCLADEVSTLDTVESSLKTSDIDKLSLFELSQDATNVCSDQKVELAEIKKTDADKQTRLRKRHTDTSEMNKTKEEIDKTNESEKNTNISKNGKKHDEDDDENPPKKERSSNSLSLFGILTPQPLRTSQKNFEDGVSIAVSLADLKLKLSLLQCRYKRLREQKLSLLSDEQ